MLGRIAYGTPPDYVRKTPESRFSVSLADLCEISGLPNVVSGHDPEIMIFDGVGDGLICQAGRRTFYLGLPVKAKSEITKEMAVFLMERVAFTFHDWGAKEIVRTARLTGRSMGHECLYPEHWVISDFEQEWMTWAQLEVRGGHVIYKPTAEDQRLRLRASSRSEYHAFMAKIPESQVHERA